MTGPVWTILIPTLSRRGDRFARLIEGLAPQLEDAGGRVTVEALWNRGERPLPELRQDLMEHARSAYTSFVDDDDELPSYYVSEVLPLLDGEVHFIGWRMQFIQDGHWHRPTLHSLRYPEPAEDLNFYYRNVSHLNPVRRDIAMKHANWRLARPGHDDGDWCEQIRGHLVTEKYIDRCMYYYHRNTPDSASGEVVSRDPPGAYARPEIGCPWFSYHPASSPWPDILR